MNALAYRARARQRGLGLVEVLVSMTIGLVMLGALGYLFVGSKHLNSTQADLARIQEASRNALDVMGRAARQANYKLNVEQDLSEPAVGGTDGGGSGAAALSDVLVLRHDPAWLADTSGTVGRLLGSENNCEGGTVSASVDPDPTTGLAPVNATLVEYRFLVRDGKLICQANPDLPDSTGVVVADNVENMQVSYGVGSGNEVIVSYADASAALDFNAVSAVRVSLLLRGPAANMVPGQGQSYSWNGATVTSSDGHLRRVVSATFAIRNQARWN